MNISEIENFGHEELKEQLKIEKGNLKKLSKKLDKQKNELEKAIDWEHLKQLGDSLLAVQSEIKKGLSEYIILNLYTQKEEIIKLNPKCTATKNAELYFKKASKGKRGHEICSENVAQTQRDIRVKEEVIEQIRKALALEVGSDEFSKAVNDILFSLDDDKTQKCRNGTHQKESIPFRHYEVDGYDIYLGKNSTQNDELSTKFAKPWDIWFHVVAHPGSHCIIRMKKNAPLPPPYILEIAAAFSAWFSNLKHTTFAEVHMTEARFVRKRRRAPAGEVIAERCKSIRVAPISPQVYFKER